MNVFMPQGSIRCKRVSMNGRSGKRTITKWYIKSVWWACLCFTVCPH